MKESDIKEIIERRKVLVETATSGAQREIYQGYLEHWEGMIKKPKKEKPKEPEPVIEPVVIPEPKINNKVKCSICSREITIQNIERHEKACKKAKLERELEALTKELPKEEIEEHPELQEIIDKEPESTEKTNI